MMLGFTLALVTLLAAILCCRLLLVEGRPPVVAADSNDEDANCECGISSSGAKETITEMEFRTDNLIFQGSELDNDQALPWMATLQMEGNKIFCSGSIIGARHILTAAHCLKQDEIHKIFPAWVGVGSTSGTKSKLVEIKPEMIVRHPGTKFSYNLSTNTYGSTKDLLLIELPEALDLSDPTLKPICLSGKQPPVDWMALAAGWGLTSPICEAKLLTMGTPDQLHIGRVEVLNSTAECRNHQFDVNLTKETFEDKMCTLSMPSSPQRGDSGGPLLVHDGKRWRQIGTVSGGDCSKTMMSADADVRAGRYELYTRIDCLWIKSATSGAVQCVK